MKALGDLNVGDRARSVDASVVYEIVKRSGGSTMRQEIIKWDSYSKLDCLTIFGRSNGYADVPNAVVNDDFMVEASNCKTTIDPWRFQPLNGIM